jgi:hypothetical protein
VPVTHVSGKLGDQPQGIGTFFLARFGAVSIKTVRRVHTGNPKVRASNSSSA